MGALGYSSEGFLSPADLKRKTGSNFQVQAVRLEDYIGEKCTFMKLDLQGGSLTR